ncbi:MAG: metallophosphoesterase [Candidatus Hinthialibacter antarcticus]|nr:metallophosphoesterase [Candidatus Hinthialibacter antarcticus]
MAWLSNPPTRRQFMQTIISGAAAYSVMPSKAAGEISKWAWLSDTHIPQNKPDGYRGFDPQDNLTAAVPQVLEAKPEGVVITGDLARLEGFEGDYAMLKQIAKPMLDELPVCMALGNHDNRANFTKAFQPHIQNAQEVANKHIVSVETPTARLVTLDSLLYVNKVAGLLGKGQRAWLETYLESIDDKPVVLFVHHTLDDSDGSLLDSDWLLKHVASVPKVKAIVYGHSHVYRFEEVDGLHLINLPALGYNFRDTDPIGWVLAELRQDGVDLTLNAIGGDTSSHGKTTSLKWRS